jgi:hypothetical protein
VLTCLSDGRRNRLTADGAAARERRAVLLTVNHKELGFGPDFAGSLGFRVREILTVYDRQLFDN